MAQYRCGTPTRQTGLAWCLPLSLRSGKGRSCTFRKRRLFAAFVAGKHGGNRWLAAHVKLLHAAGGLGQGGVLGRGFEPLHGEKQGRMVAPFERGVQDAAGTGMG